MYAYVFAVSAFIPDVFFFFKQKAAYEMRISDWSSDVCSSDLNQVPVLSYPLLARAVYFTSKMGQEIRDDLYVAVASVLAFVFSVERERLAQPMIEVPEDARFDENGRPL